MLPLKLAINEVRRRSIDDAAGALLYAQWLQRLIKAYFLTMTELP